MWCTLNNKAVKQAMPDVSFKGEVIERTNSLRYLGIHNDRMLMCKNHESTKLKRKKQKTNKQTNKQTNKKTTHTHTHTHTQKPQSPKPVHIESLGCKWHRSMSSVPAVSVCDTQCLGPTTLSPSNLLEFDRVQNEAMRVILGTTKYKHIEAMRYPLNQLSMGTRHKAGQVRVHLTLTLTQEFIPRCCQKRKGVQSDKKKVMDEANR